MNSPTFYCRFNEAAINRSRKLSGVVFGLLHRLASMRPRSIDRGSQPYDHQKRALKFLASMRPRSIDRGR